jgi:hypothetical protein
MNKWLLGLYAALILGICGLSVVAPTAFLAGVLTYLGLSDGTATVLATVVLAPYLLGEFLPALIKGLQGLVEKRVDPT